MKTNEIACSIGTKISLGFISSDNIAMAAPLAGAAIIDEKLSYLIHVKAMERDWDQTVLIPVNPGHTGEYDKIEFKPSREQLVFSRKFFFYSLDHRVVEASHLSCKDKGAISLKDIYLSIRKDSADLFDVFGLEKNPYASFFFGGAKNMPIQICVNNRQFEAVSDVGNLQIALSQWFKSGYPHRFLVKQKTDNGYNNTLSTKYESEETFVVRPPMLQRHPLDLPLSFDFEDANGITIIRVYKLIMINPYAPPTKVYLPLTNWGTDKLHPEAGTLLKVPLPGKQLLYHLGDIHAASAVVLCTSLEDAYGLKMTNARQTEVAFTAFVCDHGRFDEVDLDPLREKKLYVLISNQSKRSIPEEYLEANSLYMYLRKTFGDQQPVCFIHREVEYPEVGFVQDVAEIFSAYKSSPPSVRRCEMIAESEFQRRVREITAFLQDQAWIAPEENREDADCGRDRTKQMLVRSLLSRGNITIVHGPAKVGKTTLALGASAMVVFGKQGNVLMKGSAITTPRDVKPGKVVYLMFDPNCANNATKLKRDVTGTYGLGEPEVDNLIMLPMIGRGEEFKKNSRAISDEVHEAVEKHGAKGRSPALIVIDTTTFISRDESSVMRAVVSFSAAFPKAAILCLSHDNASGEASGDGLGNGKISGMCTHVIKLENEDNGVHFSVETSNDLVLSFDSKGFTYKIVNSHGKMELVEPARSEDEARATVKEQLMEAGASAEECARQLGLTPSALRAAVQRSRTPSDAK